MADKPGVPAGSGSPAGLNKGVDSVTIDPFHSNVLYAWAGVVVDMFLQDSAAASWHPSSLPFPSTS